MGDILPYECHENDGPSVVTLYVVQSIKLLAITGWRRAKTANGALYEISTNVSIRAAFSFRIKSTMEISKYRVILKGLLLFHSIEPPA